MTEMTKENVYIVTLPKNEFRDYFMNGITNFAKNEDESFEFNYSVRVSNYLIKLSSLGLEICEKYFLLFPQKIYKVRQVSLSQFVYIFEGIKFTFQFLNDKTHN